ncbi:MAG: acyltransferase [Clostridia bacterium]|nr:acyltransferase [Clostridia bacterium]
MAASTRKSGVELIKILSVVLIVLCHTVPETFEFANGQTYVDGSATNNLTFIIVSFFSGAGLIGDVIFIVCSSYFLLDSKRISVKKIATMILNVLVISLLFMTVILSLGYKLSAITIVKQVFPTVFQNNWFISYYIVFYLMHPLFNLIIERLNKLSLGIAAALLFFHCSILLYALGNAPSTNKFLCFVNIYFVVAYFKKYGQSFCNSKKINLILCILSAALYVALRLGLNFLGLKIDYLHDRMLGYVHINCPVLIVFSLTLFNLVNMLNWRSKTVNYLSSLSLLIYIIHHNNLFAKFIQPKWYTFFLGNVGEAHFISCLLSLAVLYFAASVILATAYRYSIEIGVKKLSEKIEYGVLMLIDRIKQKRKPQEYTEI